MTYQEELVKAQRGETDQKVLEVFQSAYEEVKRGSDAQLINERKTNLAALLLDIANKIGDAGLACFTLRCMPAVARPYRDTVPLRPRHLDGHVPRSRKAVRGGSGGVSPRRGCAIERSGCKELDDAPLPRRGAVGARGNCPLQPVCAFTGLTHFV
jgi:hypothetical protein